MNFFATIARKALLPILLLTLLSKSAQSQTTLVTGDIAFSGYIAADPTLSDQFSFVILKNITANTVIKFTDYGWRTDLGGFSSGTNNESEITFTTNAAFNAGTEFVLVSNPTTTVTVGGVSAGTVVYSSGQIGVMGAPFLVGNLSLSSSGDQLFAYQGTFLAPTFIAGFHTNVMTTAGGDPNNTDAANWDGVLTGGYLAATTSGKPPALTTGTNAIWIGTTLVSGSEKDNAHFTCGPDVSTIALARAALNNQANWFTSDATAGFTLPTGCNYVNILAGPPVFTTNPSNSTICAGTNTSFTIVATGAASYQWQVDNGGGFANISDNATYSGSTATTLNITAAANSMNGYLYRCVATNGSGSTNSTAGTLTVVPLPINPTLLLKTPSSNSVADGTSVSATFNSGSGGTGCADDYRYTIDGGASYLPYTPGANISTTGLAAASGVVTIEGRRASCTGLCQSSYIALATWIVTPLPAGASTLAAGDIAFSAYSSASDEFSFVLLKNIGTGTVLNFTDNGWYSNNTFRSGEETVTWTSNAAYSAGTEIKIAGLTSTLAAGGSAGTVTGTAGGLGLSASGDQILVYQGSVASPVFITAIHMNVYTVANGDATNTSAGAWDGAAFPSPATSVNASALPTGLTTGVNAIWIGTPGVITSEYQNAAYGNCSGPGTLGSIATLRAALNNQANWIRDNNTPLPGFVIPTGCPYLGLGTPPNITGQPANSSVCELANTSFTITAGGATSYQWQVDPGTGFVNVVDNATYSGSTTATLNINATPLSFNGYQYRCIASNGSGSSTSNAATLTVTALPVGPTLLLKTPASLTVADGTPVSATFNAGAGGTGCLDDYRYTIDGGASYLPYTPGNNISTTGLAAGSGFVFIEGRRANCVSSCQGAYKVLAMWKVSPFPAGATTLNAGDIAFSSYAATTDEFSFVLLRNIGPGTVINFTTNGWYSNNTFRSGEETITWTAPAGGLNGGVEIKISGLTATLSGAGAAGTVTGTPLTLSITGDQILAYRGTVASPTFISAIHMNVYTVANGDPASTSAAAWDGIAYASPAVNTNASALPTGLTTGVNAIWIGTQDVLTSEYANAAYGSCAGPGVLGPLTGLRAALNNQANWVRDNNPVPGFAIPTGCNYLLAICPIITVTNPGVTTGTNGTPFSQTFTQSGGALPVSFTTSSTLPNGLTLSTAGVLSGTPSAPAGTYPILVTVTDANGCSGAGSTYNLVISCQAITVSNPAVTTGQLNVAFSQTFTQTGGIGAVTFTTASTLPNGILLSSGGVLSGTPTQTGPFPIVVTVTDANGCTGTSATYNLVINSCPVITLTNPAVNTGAYGVPFSQTFTSSGGAAPVLFSTSSTLPAGLSLSTLGVLSGTPTEAGIFSITVTATDNNSCTGSSLYSLTIACPVVSINPVSNQTDCNGSLTIPVVFSGSPAGTTFSWTNNTPSISLAASGNGNIPSFTATNATSAPVTATISVTPSLATGTSGSSNFGYTGAMQTFTVPAGVSSIHIKSWGAQGGSAGVNNTNLGGYAEGDLNVTPGEVLNIYVGQQPAGNTGGFNGGGNGENIGQGGGGASDVRQGGNTIANRKIVAAGGGGGGDVFAGIPIFGGVGGALTGGDGFRAPDYATNPGGQGATQSASGTGTCVSFNNPAVSGGLGFGGSPVGCGCNGYGGGGGYYGGAGSGNCRGGGGGSSYIGGVTGGTTTGGINAGNGSVNISYGTICTGTPTTFNITVNPTATVNPVANQSVCNNANTTAVTFSSPTTGGTIVYNWTNSNTSIGLGASGTGNIASFTATNSGTVPAVATITVTPTYTNGVTCVGTPLSFTITVNPTPVASITPAGPLTICQGSSVTLTASATCTNFAFSGLLSGTQAVPSNASTANGVFNGTYDASTNQVTVNIVFNGLTGGTATAAHIHSAAAGTNGPVIIPFTGFPAATSGTYTNTFTVPPAEIANLLAGNTYINIHNAVFPGGEIRGQITNVSSNVYTLSGALSGTQSVPANASSATGNYAGTYNNVTGILSLNVVFNGLVGGNANAAHIHAGAAGTNGPVIIPFAGFPAASSGSYSITTAVPAAQIAGFLSGNTYINIHNGVFPGGEIRGQVAAPVPICANTYLWSPGGEITQSISVSAANTYSVTVSNGTTCSASASVVVNVNPVPVGSASPQTICSGGTTNVALISTTPAAGTTYSYTAAIQTTPTGGTITGQASGTANLIAQTLTNTGTTFGVIRYTVTPTYTNGGQACPGASFTVDVTVNPTAIGSASPQTICSGGTTSVTLNSTTPAAGTTYSYTASIQTTPTGGTITGQASGTANPIVQTLTNTGTTFGVIRYTVTPTYTNAGQACAGASFTVDVTVNPPTPAGSASPQTICSGGTTNVVLSASTPPAGTTYSYTAAIQTTPTGGTITGQASGTANPIAQTLINTGTTFGVIRYTVTATYTNAGQACVGTSFTVDVTVNPTPAGSASPQIICSGGTTNVALSANTPAAGTTYSYTAAILTTPTGGTITGQASGTANPIAQTLTNTGTTFGVIRYTVTPTYTNAGQACAGASFTVDVIVNPTAVGSAAAQTICNGGTTSVTLNSTTPAAGTTYSYTAVIQTTPTGGTITGQAGGTANPIAQTLTNTGTTFGVIRYTVTPTYTNAGQACAGASFTVDVTVNPTPVGSASAQTICSGGTTSVTLNSTTPAAGTTYSYTAAIQTTPTGGTITGQAAGTANPIAQTLTNTGTTFGVIRYTVTPTYTNAGQACAGASFTVDVTVNPTALGSASPQTICSGGTTNVALSANTPAAGTTYSYTAAIQTTPTGGTITGQSSGTANPIAQTLTNTGNTFGVIRYTVTPTYTNAGQACSGPSFTVDVTVNPKAIGSASPQTICNGGTTSVTLNSTTPAAGTTYSYTAAIQTTPTGGTITGQASGTVNPIAQTLTNTGTTAGVIRYTVTPTYTNAGQACAGNSFTVDVTVNPTPVGSASAQTICSGGTTSVALNSTTPAAGTTYAYTAAIQTTPTGGTITGQAAGTANPIAQTLTNTGTTFGVIRYTVTPTYTNAGQACAGASFTVDVTVNPTPVGSASPQTICSGGTTSVTLNSTTPAAGTTYSYTAAIQTAPTGGTITGQASGTVNPIAQTLTNTGTTFAVIRYTVTPTYTNAGQACAGASFTVDVTVNPTPVGSAAAQTICSGGTTSVTLNSTTPAAGTTYSYTAAIQTTPAGGTITGQASGTANPIAQTLTNTGNTFGVIRYTVIPTYTNAGQACVGASFTVDVTVNPKAIGSATAQTICNGGTTSVTLSSNTPPAGTTYSYTAAIQTAPTGGTITGQASGTANPITQTLTNTGTSPGVIRYTVIPTYTNAGQACAGPAFTVDVTVNPTATVTPVANQTVCHNTSTAAVTFSSPTTGGTIVYNWTNSLTSIGLGASGTGNIPSFIATNTGAAAVTATITVTPSYTNGSVTCVGTPFQFTITVNTLSSAPTGAISSSTQLCGAGYVTLTAQGGFLGTGATYQWYSGSCGGTPVGTGPVVTNVYTYQTTTYYVRIEGVCNTTTCQSVTVRVDPQPVVVITAVYSSASHPGHPVKLYATVSPAGNNYQFVWSRNGVVIPGHPNDTLNIPANASGQYSVRVTAVPSGCFAVSNVIDVHDSVITRHLFIQPNPNNGIFTVSAYATAQEIGSTRSVIVIDGKGSRVFAHTYPVTVPYDLMDVNINGRPKGEYVVTVVDASGKVIASAIVVIGQF